MKIRKCRVLQIAVCILLGVFGSQAQTPSSAVVPQLVNYSGKATDATGNAITGITGITFSIYKDQYEGSPLWMETQNVTADDHGNYSVQLGATKAVGLPLDVFTSGEARWLGVRINGGEEQPRVMLLSVPYALKAGDAATVGGLPPSAFMLAAPASSASVGVPSSAPSETVQPALSGSGTADYVPLWTPDGNTLGNSVLFQSGTGSSAKIGINTTTPTSMLDIKGGETVRGTLTLPATGSATATAGKNSQPGKITASSYNSSSKAAAGWKHVGELGFFSREWIVGKIGINTTTPASTLDVKGGATVRGTLVLPSTGTANSSSGKMSQAQKLSASVFNSGVGTAVSQMAKASALPAPLRSPRWPRVVFCIGSDGAAVRRGLDCDDAESQSEDHKTWIPHDRDLRTVQYDLLVPG